MQAELSAALVALAAAGARVLVTEIDGWRRRHRHRRTRYSDHADARDRRRGERRAS